VLLVLLLSSFVVSCAPKPIALTPAAVKLSAESYTCKADPGPWADDATDAEVASNIRLGRAALKDCHRQIYTLCKVAEANDLLAEKGKCLEPFKKQPISPPPAGTTQPKAG
jgi:hypothetical protein